MLLTLFDVMDDTVTVKKSILSELKAELKQVLDNTYGRKVCAAIRGINIMS